MKRLSRVQTIAAAFVMSIAVVVPLALAQTTGEGPRREHRHEWRGHREFGGDRLLSQLDLTDAQKDQIRQIRESNRQNLRPLMEQIRAKRQEIRQATRGGTFDENLVRQKLTEIAPLEAKLMAEQFRIRQETLSVLTPEQKTKLDQLREGFKSRHSGRRARKAQTSL